MILLLVIFQAMNDYVASSWGEGNYRDWKKERTQYWYTKPTEKTTKYVNEEYCMCGQTTQNINVEVEKEAYDYIIGGSEAKPHQFPWMVRIVGGCLGELTQE